ncbi:MAG: hypothetical protein RL607_1760 [Bacteroidota bacterium]|jgi:HSP20 family protein
MTLVKRNAVNFPSVFDEFFKPDWMGGIQNFGANVPAVNIKETDTAFGIELAAPGKHKSDFTIEIDLNVLTISSETKAQNESSQSEGRYTRREFSYASFKRSFTLPESVNTEAIQANYENGVLQITLPKRDEALPKPKRLIEIG